MSLPPLMPAAAMLAYGGERDAARPPPPSSPRINDPIRTMGLTFANALGLAAGLDHTGSRLTELATTGVGHIEVGTVTDPSALTVARDRLPQALQVGINFASPQTGLDDTVVDDYARLLRALWPHADYLVANLSSPYADRTGDTPGIEPLIERLAVERDALSRATGCRKPLLVKICGGEAASPLPKAVAAVRRFALDGIVLVTAAPRRISECREQLSPAAVVSVGGITSPQDAARRLAAGARLVQIHSAFATEGPAAVMRLLAPADSDGRAA